MQGGNDGARDALKKFWRAVSDSALTSPLRRTPIDALFGGWSLDHSPAYLAPQIVLQNTAASYTGKSSTKAVIRFKEGDAPFGTDHANHPLKRVDDLTARDYSFGSDRL